MKNALEDVFGAAFKDYLNGMQREKLDVFIDIADKDEIDVSYFFRAFKDMPLLEQQAVGLAKGDILDAGAGAGSHSLYLQDNGFKVHAIDTSSGAVEVMKKRGIASAECMDFFQLKAKKFDTIFLLMNGIGLIRRLEYINAFFEKLNELLSPEGQLIFDSSDIIYMYEEDDGSYRINLNEAYYGEVNFSIAYKNQYFTSFPWIYIDFQTMAEYAEKNDFEAELISRGDHFDYLARIKRKQ